MFECLGIYTNPPLVLTGAVVKLTLTHTDKVEDSVDHVHALHN
jgi:hypothetical protein